MKRAVIDIGTNSSLLLTGSVTDKNQISCDLQKFIVTRVGEGISESNKIKEEAMYRTVEALEEYNQIIKKSQVESVYVLGTKALRKADLNTMIRRRCVLHRRYG